MTRSVKMKLYEVSDEFENREFISNEDKRKYLFRVQKAKCNELINFFVELNHRFPTSAFDQDKRTLFNLAYLHSSNTARPHSIAWKYQMTFPFPTQKELPPTKERFRLKSIFLFKYARMLHAKQKFEEAGGKYTNYRDENLSEMSDEFENKSFGNDEEKQKYFFRMQRSKCHEIDLFILNLARKFPMWWKFEGKNQWSDYPTREWDELPVVDFPESTKNWILPTMGSPFSVQEIKQHFETKYKAMRQAKIAYENAGGNYGR